MEYCCTQNTEPIAFFNFPKIVSEIDMGTLD